MKTRKLNFVCVSSQTFTLKKYFFLYDVHNVSTHKIFTYVDVVDLLNISLFHIYAASEWWKSVCLLLFDEFDSFVVDGLVVVVVCMCCMIIFSLLNTWTCDWYGFFHLYTSVYDRYDCELKINFRWNTWAYTTTF